MNEIQAGLTRPSTLAEMAMLLAQHEELFVAAHEAAEALRNRIANGERTIADCRSGKLTGLNPGAIERAEQQMEALKQELRTYDFQLIAGLGLTLTWGVAETLAEYREKEGWRLPPGSVMRLILPGIANVAADLTS